MLIKLKRKLGEPALIETIPARRLPAVTLTGIDPSAAAVFTQREARRDLAEARSGDHMSDSCKAMARPRRRPVPRTPQRGLNRQAECTELREIVSGNQPYRWRFAIPVRWYSRHSLPTQPYI